MIKKDNIYWRNNFLLQITGKCNLNCAHCFENGSQDIEMSTEIMDRLLDFSDKFDDIIFSGGEPTLALDKMQYFLNECKRRNKKIYRIDVFTNGTGFNQEFYNILLGYKRYIRLCLEEYVGKSVNDECARMHVNVHLSHDKYHNMNVNVLYKKAIELNFHKVSLIAVETGGNVVLRTGRGKEIGIGRIEEFKVGKIGVSHRNSYCPFAEYLCKTEKDPAVMCKMEVDYNGNLYANGYPKSKHIICNIMNTESILDAIDIWNNKNPLHCLEAEKINKKIRDEKVDVGKEMEKEVDMFCDLVKCNKDLETLEIEEATTQKVYQMYGDTEEEVYSKLKEIDGQNNLDEFLWNYKYGKYSDIHLLYPELGYEECKELAVLSSEKIQNRKRILSLKYENFMREVEQEIKFRNRTLQEKNLCYGAIKRKYDSGTDPEMLCQVLNEMFNDNMSVQEFVDSMQCYEEFTEATKVNGLCYWFKCRIDEYKNDNVTEEESFLFEDILLHYLAYCTFVENNLSDKMDDDMVKGIVDVAREYKSFFEDLLSVDALLFSIQNSKDQRLGREATFSDEELKDAMERLNNDLLLRLKYIKLRYIFQSLNK
ncbi:MAG: radical SAM protein [Anaerobutyricum soehngenii]